MTYPSLFKTACAINFLAFFGFVYWDKVTGGDVARFFSPVLFLALSLVYFLLVVWTATPPVFPPHPAKRLMTKLFFAGLMSLGAFLYFPEGGWDVVVVVAVGLVSFVVF